MDYLKEVDIALNTELPDSPEKLEFLSKDNELNKLEEIEIEEDLDDKRNETINVFIQEKEDDEFDDFESSPASNINNEINNFEDSFGNEGEVIEDEFGDFDDQEEFNDFTTNEFDTFNNFAAADKNETFPQTPLKSHWWQESEDSILQNYSDLVQKLENSLLYDFDSIEQTNNGELPKLPFKEDEINETWELINITEFQFNPGYQFKPKLIWKNSEIKKLTLNSLNIDVNLEETSPCIQNFTNLPNIEQSKEEYLSFASKVLNKFNSTLAQSLTEIQPEHMIHYSQNDLNQLQSTLDNMIKQTELIMAHYSETITQNRLDIDTYNQMIENIVNQAHQMKNNQTKKSSSIFLKN
ncbi:hypothetical protein CONCODRAFT_79830 [Conidiobolus coronatus NRRL 28638]|uniref:Uncharacterized protein n=1 Tax=Conidiobolus coronatus (strain ATCC 28846 / CBS 209.66 / NRRL 28638) TaxID=796925 RepID=A0A137P015_CONC2|nr:hypothetical protein CONCODRAFT_79830 [Conidiobolus coronatus NRRL 28638]|eukprot:KXN68261.1 hypothetical protein CONCODRAFT_79830 [Conidiobolus coronatus NRRL 28638]